LGPDDAPDEFAVEPTFKSHGTAFLFQSSSLGQNYRFSISITFDERESGDRRGQFDLAGLASEKDANRIIN